MAWGFVQRDLKPDNILFNNDGPLVIADWGIGCFIHRESKVLEQLTRGGMGTEYYCSLEQWATLHQGRCRDFFVLGPADKSRTLLIGIDAVHRTRTGFVALTSDDATAIQSDAWLVTRGKDGKWGASPWVHLIRRAVESEVDASGALWVNPESGAMRIDTDGSQQYGGCLEHLNAALEKPALPR